MQRTQIDTLDDALVRLGSRITAWVLGAGLLSLHATVFTLSMVTMVFWNIYDKPQDLWVTEVFRRWGALLAFHAIVVAAGWAVWKLLRAEQRAIDAAGRQWTPVLAEPPAYPVEPSAAWVAAPAGIEPVRRGPDATQRAMVFARQAVVTWVDWSDALGRHAIRAYRSTATLVRTRTQRGGPAATDTITPPMSWPAAPVRSDEEEFIANFAPSAPPEIHTEVTTAATDIILTSTMLAEPAEPQAPIIPIVKDANATWLETATASWLPRQAENGSGETHNGHHPKPDISPDPGNPPPAVE